MSNNSVTFIPIGVDCGGAFYLRETQRRSASYPFDWVVSYSGVNAALQDGLARYCEVDCKRVNPYDVYFHHDYEKPEDKASADEKYKRRCDRLLTLLRTAKPNQRFIFWRLGHSRRHHLEHNQRFRSRVQPERARALELSHWLQTHFPSLQFRIVVTHCCKECPESSSTAPSPDAHVLFGDCSRETHNYGKVFDQLVETIQW